VSRARELARFVPDCVVLLRRLARRPGASRAERWLLPALVAYLASPIDLIPDFLPGIGQLDDALLALFVLRRLVRRHGARAIREEWPGSEASLRVVLRAVGAAGGTTL
jgi:uncharacterized membrane protein YkvA (DUF1232 family)